MEMDLKSQKNKVLSATLGGIPITSNAACKESNQQIVFVNAEIRALCIDGLRLNDIPLQL